MRKSDLYFRYGVTGLIIILLYSGLLFAGDNFRVYPYLQNPSTRAITIIWFSEENVPGILSWREKGSETNTNVNSIPVSADGLVYSTWEDTTFFKGEAPCTPFRHRIRIGNLNPATGYEYSVTQGTETFTSTFHTAPEGNIPIRFIVYGDSETEPESTGSFTRWVDPVNAGIRSYLIDQTTGYKNNLSVIRSRNPDLVFIAGDLVENGGEQRDWDEFWNHNTGPDTGQSVAGVIPVLGVLGNHEYYEGPYLGRFDRQGSERAVRRFLTYFESPSNNSPVKEHEGRYYSFQYGPATFVVMDVCNNGLNKSGDDTNFYLPGESDPDGGNAPDFGPGSRQYEWLEARLKESQIRCLFTFIIFHHSPYSSGPHGYPAGESENTDKLSGYPVRLLTPLFMQYGVDAVISGHDEMWERSIIHGIELRPDNTGRPHSIHFYDVGQGGDGLREPEESLENPCQEFLVHTDVPEIWENGILVSGGKHYGHLEVDIMPVDENTWQAILKPVYIFPIFDITDSAYSKYERRIYDDQVTLTSYLSDINVFVENVLQGNQEKYSVSRSYPNPSDSMITIECILPEPCQVSIIIHNIQGKVIRTLEENKKCSGLFKTVWNGEDDNGNKVNSGLYFYRIETTSGLHETKQIILVD